MRTVYKHECRACGELAFDFHEGLHSVETVYYWVCDHCGTQMEIAFADDGRTCEQRPTGRRCENTLALFEVRGFPAMRFVYQGFAWDGDLDHEYFYNEHTCPTNILRCEEIFIDGEIDPHGAFRLIREVLITGPDAMDRNEAEDMLVELACQESEE